MGSSNYWIILLPIFCLLSRTSLSLRFALDSGRTKCIAEDMKLNVMAVGKYSVIAPSDGHSSPASHKITARVTTPYGSSIHHADSVDSGDFAFTSTEEGDYLACFWAHESKPATTLTVEFEWKMGVAAKGWPMVAKKGQIKAMELELKKLEETVWSIHEEMFYLREREEEMQDLNRSINSRMGLLSALPFLICLSVVGLQLWHLKKFFEKKKVL